MLFNSYPFIFSFLPLTLAGFFLLGRGSREWALRWLIAASLFFYAWWRPVNVLIIAPSIIINFFLARTLQRLAREKKSGAARWVLAVGIAFNVLFLGYFKYANFFATATNDAFGTSFVLERIILPLGISFITFQKIAFLVDVHSGRIEEFTLQDYCLFVLFFPQLIAGPIVHYREMMPQFHRATGRFDRENFALGVTLFVFGLFKKVVLADTIAPAVSSIYANASAGTAISLVPAWMAALGFTLQIYFDFSGYTDMALGLGRFFGIKFPPNFNSPLKASNIIDFWLRWHMTLTRFLTAYIYNPLSLSATRRRAAKGLRPFGGRNTSLGGFLQVLMVPTLITMFISGFWHGAGYLFIVWGLLHGVYLTINHAWRIFAARRWPDRARYARVMGPVGFVITFVAVVAGMVVFRAPTIATAANILRGMIGLNGLALPSSIVDRLGHFSTVIGRLNDAVISPDAFRTLTVWIVILGFFALALPNTLKLLSAYEPALGIKPSAGPAVAPGRRLAAYVARLTWAPTIAWAVAVSILAVFGIFHLGGNSEFLYWQF
jgi:D-alanyl-lipoteichoic acid acyltransferase DltB (MBOAT superfamily)